MISLIKKFIPSQIKIALNKLVYKVFTPPQQISPPEHYPVSYSQVGEDIIVNYILAGLGVTTPTYLDIGANDPISGNNTYSFYKRGCYGLCIEPDPDLFKELKNKREKDICLNIAIGVGDETEADFYIFSEPSLNTLSQPEAEYREKNGSHKVVAVKKIEVRNINEIFKEYFIKPPDFVSIDVEGLDFDIVKSINYDNYRPLIICTETIIYSETRTKQKISEIADFLRSKDYMVFADTYINTIFVDSKVYTSITNINT